MGANIWLDWGDEDSKKYVYQFASNGGRKGLHDWARGLPKGTGESLKRLLDEGEFAGTDVLAGDVAAALESNPPADEAVAHTAGDLLTLLDGGAGPETAVLLDDVS